jgi:hypothetical protein
MHGSKKFAQAEICSENRSPQGIPLFDPCFSELFCNDMFFLGSDWLAMAWAAMPMQRFFWKQ